MTHTTMPERRYCVAYKWVGPECYIQSAVRVDATTPHHAHFKAAAKIRSLTNRKGSVQILAVDLFKQKGERSA